MKQRYSIATIQDVAKSAGVSLGTVSRVFNRKSNVDENLRDKVYRTSREIGFLPKEISPYVVLVANLEGDPGDYVRNMTFLLSRKFIEKKIKIELLRNDDISPFHDPRIMGVITMVESSVIDELSNVSNLPVFTLTTPKTNIGFHSIRVDHVQQGVVATRHLIEKGHRKIAFLATDKNEWCCTERLAGYLTAMKESGINQESSLIQFSREKSVYDIIARWVKNGVTAVLNFNHEKSLEALHILNNVLDVRIGKDISTVSIEEIPGYEWMTPPQTVVRQPLEVLANKAVDELLKRIVPSLNDEMIELKPLDISLSSELVERDSVVKI